MVSRRIDGPGKGTYVTTEEAARFLGLSVAAFRRLVGLDESDLALPGVRDWVRPVTVGRSLRWHWLSITYLAHVLAQQAGNTATPAAAATD